MENITSTEDIAVLLARFKAWVEWFRQPEIYRETKASRKGEAFLDRLLRGWLFERGVAWPYSASCPPQRSDALIAHLGDSVSHVIETACFFAGAGRQYRERAIQEAIARARQAAAAQEMRTAYVVVFNLSPHVLRFAFQSEGELFADLPAPEARVRLLPVHINPNLPTACNKAAVKFYESAVTAEQTLESVV